MSSLRCGLVAGTVLLLAAAAPARATLVTGSFTGTVSDTGSDPDNLTFLGNRLSSGDHIVGSFSFDSAAILAGVGTNTLVINVTDTTSGQGASYFDTGVSGFYGTGSFFLPTSGAYSIGAASGDGDSLSQLAALDFVSPGILNGVYAQSFTVAPGSGSFGQIEGDFASGEDDGSVNFSIDSATMSAASVPEPASLTVFGLGLLGLAGTRWRARPGAEHSCYKITTDPRLASAAPG